MDILNFISSIITVIHRGFDIFETVLKISDPKNSGNTNLKDNEHINNGNKK